MTGGQSPLQRAIVNARDYINVALEALSQWQSATGKEVAMDAFSQTRTAAKLVYDFLSPFDGTEDLIDETTDKIDMDERMRAG